MKSLELSRRLLKEGFEDVLFLSHETARKVLTEKRKEIIETIQNEDVESIRDLSRRLERKENVVYKDLGVLFEAGVVDFEEDKNRKRPVLRHKNIFVKPITFQKTDDKKQVPA